jgi:hypothetical protein
MLKSRGAGIANSGNQNAVDLFAQKAQSIRRIQESFSTNYGALRPKNRLNILL